MKFYVLKGFDVVETDNVLDWVDQMQSSARRRRVASDVIGVSNISTVFLGDHSTIGPPPLLFETMVFGGALDGELERCSTWEQAEAMHSAMCARVKATYKDNE
jgi:hypothetical protein